MSELTEMAKELTEFNPDGSIKVAGFVPWFGYYEFTPLELSIIFGADYYNEDGTASAVASDPDWQALFQWQKDLVDFYGADNLKEFVAGQGDEWSEPNDFHRGRVAMMFDGEWRVAMIEDYAPDLNYGTAPYPTPDGQEDQYGIGRVGGTIVGIPRGSAHPAEAWLLVQYLATNTDALVEMTNIIRNVPTTFPALESPDARHHAAVPDVPRRVRRSGLALQADERDRDRGPGSGVELRRGLAGGGRLRPAGGAAVDRGTDRQRARGRRRLSRCRRLRSRRAPRSG